MSRYSAFMYSSDTARQTPIRNLKRHKRRKQKYDVTSEPVPLSDNTDLHSRLKRGRNIDSLSSNDVQSLLYSVAQAAFVKTSFIRDFFHFDCLCKKRRDQRALTRSSERFERLLDTRNLASVHTNLTLLLRLLMKEE